MAVSYITRKCTQCAGKLKYIKDKKIWLCVYCGAEIEREESYDGLFTIKNVVRQSLLDIANRRLDSAEKNLIECEKIDSRYVGTLIAKIAFEMIRVITPGACDTADTKNAFSRLKRNYDQLKEVSETISDEEESLYEFLEESDIYATLLLVYDSLGDTQRRDYVFEMIEPSEIYSKHANSNLFSYSIKNSKFDLVDKVLNNIDNLDIESAFKELLEKYPDNESKSLNVDKIYETNRLQENGKNVLENYLSSSSDSVDTKSKILVSALQNGVKIGVEMIVSTILSKAGEEQNKAILTALCARRLNDEDVLKILNFAYECGSANIALSSLNVLKQSGQYVVVPGKYLISMLSHSGYLTEDKIKLLSLSFEFKFDNKTLESVITNYLCYNSDESKQRKSILDCLFEKTDNFPTSTVENYVLRCTADCDLKPIVVKDIFSKDLNLSFFSDLLSDYMGSSVDSQEVKQEVVDILVDVGLKIDPGALIDYICYSSDDVPGKIRFIKKMLANGAQLRSDAANMYLEKTKPENFSSELFSVVFVPGSSFGPRAIENYILRFRERDAVKAQNIATILDVSPEVAFNLTCQIVHLNNRVTCNLAQAYMLLSSDSQMVAFAVMDVLLASRRLKLNEEIQVSDTTMKLKKYVVSNKSSLSETTNAICEKYKVYSMIF